MNAEVPQYAVQDEIYVDPARTALVVVDMQNDLVKQGGSLLVPDAEATVAAITRLLELARASGMRVVYTQDAHRRGDPEWEIWPEHCREGSWGWEIITEPAPGPDDSVLRKVRYDAFYGTPLNHLLRVGGVDALVVCGTLANICVQYTAASAALRWYRVVIPCDAISALEPFDLEAVLRQTVFAFAGRLTTYLRSRSRVTPTARRIRNRAPTPPSSPDRIRTERSGAAPATTSRRKPPRYSPTPPASSHDETTLGT